MESVNSFVNGPGDMGLVLPSERATRGLHTKEDDSRNSSFPSGVCGMRPAIGRSPVCLWSQPRIGRAMRLRPGQNIALTTGRSHSGAWPASFRFNSSRGFTMMSRSPYLFTLGFRAAACQRCRHERKVLVHWARPDVTRPRHDSGSERGTGGNRQAAPCPGAGGAFRTLFPVHDSPERGTVPGQVSGVGSGPGT
jgi:hypothetical protein